MGKLTVKVPTAELARRAANAGHLLVTEHLLQVARSLVPIEEATLERSGATALDEANLRANVTFDTVYAARQHEELTWKHDAGRQAKYLEAPSISEKTVMAALMAKAAKEAMG